jgi:hypothetical protein
MYRARQSQADRLKRLDDCRCPVHGCSMSQLTGYFSIGDDDLLPAYTHVQCDRRDCEITAIAYHWNGPYILLDKWKHLIEE